MATLVLFDDFTHKAFLWDIIVYECLQHFMFISLFVLNIISLYMEVNYSKDSTWSMYYYEVGIGLTIKRGNSDYVGFVWWLYP